MLLPSSRLIYAILGVVLIAAGLLSMFHKDLMWRWHVWQSKVRGLEPKRTPQWETMQTIIGYVSLFIGIVILVVVIMFTIFNLG